MSYCPSCGFKNADGSNFCENCGAALGAASEVEIKVDETIQMPSQENVHTEQPAPPVAGTQQVPPPPTGAPVQTSQPPQGTPSGNGKAIGALVCGILAIILCGSVIIGAILGVVAIILGVSAAKSGADGKAKAGKICGIVGCVLSALALISYIVLGLMVGGLAASGALTGDDVSVEEIIEAITEQEDSPDVDIYYSSKSSSSSASSSSSSAASSSSASSSSKSSSSKAQSSSSDFSKMIIGAWEGNAQSGERVQIEFGTGGVYVEKYDEPDGEIISYFGTYSIKGDQLTVKTDGDKSTSTISFPDKNTLKIHHAAVDVTFTYKRMA